LRQVGKSRSQKRERKKRGSPNKGDFSRLKKNSEKPSKKLQNSNLSKETGMKDMKRVRIVKVGFFVRSLQKKKKKKKENKCGVVLIAVLFG